MSTHQTLTGTMTATQTPTTASTSTRGPMSTSRPAIYARPSMSCTTVRVQQTPRKPRPDRRMRVQPPRVTTTLGLRARASARHLRRERRAGAVTPEQSTASRVCKTGRRSQPWQTRERRSRPPRPPTVKMQTRPRYTVAIRASTSSTRAAPKSRSRSCRTATRAQLTAPNRSSLTPTGQCSPSLRKALAASTVQTVQRRSSLGSSSRLASSLRSRRSLASHPSKRTSPTTTRSINTICSMVATTSTMAAVTTQPAAWCSTSRCPVTAPQAA